MERSLKKILKILQGKLKMDSSSLANHITITVAAVSIFSIILVASATR
jgi:hypothetical protein